MISGKIRERLHSYMAGVANEEFGRALIVGGTDDHVHALLSLHADVSVSRAACKLKSLSSGWVHRTFEGCRDFAWQPGYGAFSVSASKIADVTAYIKNQVAHHRKRSFEEEFVAFLNRHGVEYDPKRIWG
jgi:REP element-mobilizing transposase RayT